MRVCHLVYSYYPFDPRVRKEAEALADAGYEVHVVAVQDEGEVLEELVGHVRVHRIPMRIVRGSKLRYMYQYVAFFALSSVLLLRLHLRHSFRVVHVHSLPDFQVFAAWPVRMIGASSIVLDLHEAMPEILAARFHLGRHNLFLGLAKALERLSSLFATRVVVATEQRARLLETRAVPAGKTVVVMNSPDIDDARVASSDELKTELGLNGRRILVHAGGINPERDLETLIRAAERISASYPVTVLFFGRGEPSYIERVKTVASEEAPRVDFRYGGWIPPTSVFQYLALADVGLGTYERNPITELAAPHKILEYVAVDKPLVLADVKGLRAVWNGAALFYRPGDPEHLATQIQRLIEEPVLAGTLQSAARNVYERLDWKHSRAALIAMYRSLHPGG